MLIFLERSDYFPSQNKKPNRYNVLFKNSKVFKYLSIFLFIIVYFLYFLSLEKCYEGEKICSHKRKWIKTKLNEGLLSSFLLSFLLELINLNLLSKLHLVHIIIINFLFILYSHGLEFDDHGLFNFLSLLSLLIIGYIIFIPINIFLHLLKKKNNLLLFGYLLILIILFFYSNIYLTKNLSCDDWKNGLNNTYLINDINKYGCKIRIPKYCPNKFLKYLLDITKITRKKCNSSKYSRRNMLKFSKSKYINESITKKFGFPKININLLWSNKSKVEKTISSIIKKNILDMDNKNLLKSLDQNDRPEIIVDFSDNIKGKMIINLSFNESLSLERKRIEKDFHPYSNNIMILYFDSVSRANSLRHFKKTLKFFEKFMSYDSSKFHSFQFFKYHSFKDYTPGNYPKLFYDTYRKKNKRYPITYYLKKYGFVTAFSNDMCSGDPFSTLLKDISKEDICDHEFLLCDPNKMHINSMTKRCLYEKTNIDYQYEYGLKFWRIYKGNRKFLMIVNNDGHESTLEVIKYDDNIIYNFLNKLYKDNLLDNTTILLLSDHGCSLPSLYYFNDFFEFEKYLPMLYIMTTIKDDKEYLEQYQNIYENQQKFITAYDIYNTICYLILGNDYFKSFESDSIYITKSKFGINLFEPINNKRSPKDYISMENSICI